MAEKSKLTPGNWISIVGLLITILVISGGVTTQIYATKGDVAAVEMCCQKAQEQAALNRQATTYQIQTLERVQVQMDNLSTSQHADSKDIAKLLDRLRVEPVKRDKPHPVPAPAPRPEDFKPISP
jgi:hypothetical protein